jgi:hypothetical protein
MQMPLKGGCKVLNERRIVMEKGASGSHLPGQVTTPCTGSVDPVIDALPYLLPLGRPYAREADIVAGRTR